MPGGAADKAGIQKGDRIKTIDGQAVQSPTDLSSAVALKQPGDKVKIGIERNGTAQDLTATLGTRPNKTPWSSQPPSSCWH